MGQLSKADIVTRALELVGNTAIQARAELWLDLLLQDAATTYRFPELQRQASAAVAIGGTSVALPSAFGFLLYNPALKGVGRFVDGAGCASPVQEATLEAVRTTLDHGLTGATGTPRRVAADLTNSLLVFDPVSDVAGTLTVEYQAVPVAGAAADPVWFPSDLAMVDAVRDLAEQYMRGGLSAMTLRIKEASKALVLRAPSRARLWTLGGVGSDLHPGVFR